MCACGAQINKQRKEKKLCYAKKCSTALRIKNSYYAIAGGDSPDTETKLISVTELACPNKHCEKFDKPIRLRRAVGFVEEGGELYE